ncbi:hypothetical protein TBR22_A09420 [Luteitalea sp. TBR-22]|uniref:dTMP kinase n=1 Tax=Luteitalea sp. TBR-22 TaxID=2802971 RepID=UPI001AFB884D|nr:hypothetical protein [Luteitalea sp. TBR-22]BCS31738.1 hypothetical protein TBR22_A09420 [Luteitalea sp. TBR-22]
MRTEAARLADDLRARGVDCAISRWDASGVFEDLLGGPAAAHPVSPRMLALLYAADLVFRLRWEIAPALAEGRVVIAAPYVDTAVAVGVGFGLPDTWLREVLRFAPTPDARRAARERRPRKGWRRRPDRGYAECCTTLLSHAPSGVCRRRARRTAMAWMEALAAEGGALSRRRLLRLVIDGDGQDARRP